VNYCLDAINQQLEHLPKHDDVQMAVVRVKRITSEANVFHLLEKGLLEFIDELQISIGDIHDELSLTWFGPPPEPVAPPPKPAAKASGKSSQRQNQKTSAKKPATPAKKPVRIKAAPKK